MTFIELVLLFVAGFSILQIWVNLSLKEYQRRCEKMIEEIKDKQQ